MLDPLRDLIFNKRARAKEKAYRLSPVAKTQTIERERAKYERGEAEEDFLDRKYPERNVNYLA